MRKSNSVIRSPSNPTEQLAKLRDQLRQRLMRSADYRALIAIEHAIAELREQTAVEPVPPLPRRNKKTITGAASQILSEQREPFPVRELVNRLRQMGIKFKGRYPESSLSATLSRNDQFRAIRYQGKRCWWLSRHPIPDQDPLAQSDSNDRMTH
jgi:hypothetical protein